MLYCMGFRAESLQSIPNSNHQQRWGREGIECSTDRLYVNSKDIMYLMERWNQCTILSSCLRLCSTFIHHSIYLSIFIYIICGGDASNDIFMFILCYWCWVHIVVVVPLILVLSNFNSWKPHKLTIYLIQFNQIYLEFCMRGELSLYAYMKDESWRITGFLWDQKRSTVVFRYICISSRLNFNSMPHNKWVAEGGPCTNIALKKLLRLTLNKALSGFHYILIANLMFTPKIIRSLKEIDFK